MIRHPRRSPLFPSPTLFRSELIVLDDERAATERAGQFLAEAARAGGHIALSGGKSPEHAHETAAELQPDWSGVEDRKSTRLNSSHLVISYAVFCLKKNNTVHLPQLGPDVAGGHPPRIQSADPLI